MSIHENRVGGYDVRYRDATGRMRSKSFRRKRDAGRFDLKIKDAKQTGMLARLDGGTETLDDYVTGTWIPVHVAPLAAKTSKRYAQLYDRHVTHALGAYQLREITPEIVGRWQADELRQPGAPVDQIRKAHTMLGSILQRALEAGRTVSNPQRLVRKAAPPATTEVRPLAPASAEAIRHALARGAGRDDRSTRGDIRWLRDRDAVMVAILAYAGLRPQEARGLCWAHVLDRTLVVHAPKTRRYRQQPRSVRLLAPLAQDLRECRLASGRPDPASPVIPLLDGGEITETAFESWRAGPGTAALKAADLAY